MNSRHVQLIALYSTRYSIRSGIGLVFLLISLVFGLMVAHTLMQPVEMAVKQARKANQEVTTEDALTLIKDQRMIRDSIAWVLGSGEVAKIEDAEARDKAQEHYDTWIEHLLDDHPALLSTILLILFWGWPFVASFGAFNLFSGDVGSRGIRYHLIRAERSSIFFGRVLGMMLSQAVVLLFLLLTIIVFMGFKLPFYGWGPLFSWGLYGALMLIVISLPYVALCAWISASIDSPFGSLTVLGVIIGGVPLIAMLGKSSWEHIQYANYLLPWGVQMNLHHYSMVNVLGAVAACLGYTVLFLYLGHRYFTKRDL